ncbi:hypothetical protein L6452_03067 [Arctium lappa]|uniref:Uncharacterized protein n=1 Tax=Arctium lappa TaxID=4217 RepID=A0ACB9FME6_ARCLA|nr:hypothetical protein L6452_03067 [Arctium lappa]
MWRLRQGKLLVRSVLDKCLLWGLDLLLELGRRHSCDLVDHRGSIAQRKAKPSSFQEIGGKDINVGCS